MLLKLNFFNTTNTGGWTSLKMSATGTIASAIIDRDTGLATNIRAEYSGALWTASASSGLTASAHHGVEEGVWDNFNTLPIASSGTLTIIGAQIVVGASYTIVFAGATNSARNTTITANGVSATYVNTAQATPITPAVPVSLTCVAVDAGGGEGKIDFTFAGNNTLMYATFITIADAPTLNSVNTDDTVKIGETITWSASGITATSATIDGVALTGVTSTGGTIPDYADGALLPGYAGQTITISDGTKSASRTIYVYPKDGYSYTRIRDISQSGDGYIKSYYPALALDDTVSYLNGDQLSPPVDVNTVDVDGRIATDYTESQSMFIWRAADKTVVRADISVSSEPEGGLSMRDITVKGITARGITAVGL